MSDVPDRALPASSLPGVLPGVGPVTLAVLMLMLMLVAACAAPTPAVRTGGATHEQRAARTLGQFLNPLDDNFTREQALELFGEPDRVVHDLLTYFVYELPEGRTVWLGFPDEGPLKYARVRAAGASGDGPP
ncbi:MAG: hypothetical protein DRQ55_17395 [Planctomycetota bacterium]|nr:MAG: hypothetical protein DRQ55_17395 [Planctomycetota bacterium]